MVVDPSAADARQIANLLVGVILPRPIAFVSTLSAQGVPNLAPFSYFTVASSTPPVICFTPIVRRDGSKKDTLINIESTGEFVVNIVSEEFAAQMNVCSGEYPPDIDEFAVSGLTPAPSDLVKPARVRESHVSMECRLHQIVEISAKPGGGSLVLGEVLRFHVDGGIMGPGGVDPDKLRAIGRMGGPTYCRTTDRFDMQRP